MLTQIISNTPEVRPPETALLMTPGPDLSKVRKLKAEDTKEVQAFLSVRPVHTVVMTSLITDNGIVNELNRGKFYGYRNASGTLEGVALIGHSTLIECRSQEALKALAFVARSAETPIDLTWSGGNSVEDFWNYLSGGTNAPSLPST